MNIFLKQIASSEQKQSLCKKNISKIELNDFRNDDKKKNLRRHFEELLDELLN